MSMSVRCRFKGFEAVADVDALGVVDASRVGDTVVSTSARYTTRVSSAILSTNENKT